VVGNTTPNPAEYIDEAELKRFRISPRTAQRWRASGDGPAFVRLGRRVIYRVSDIEAWLEARTYRSLADERARHLSTE
jgi:hypothetical protein